MITKTADNFTKIAVTGQELQGLYKNLVRPHVAKISDPRTPAYQVAKNMGAFTLAPDLLNARVAALKGGKVPSLSLGGHKVLPEQANDLAAAADGFMRGNNLSPYGNKILLHKPTSLVEKIRRDTKAKDSRQHPGRSFLNKIRTTLNLKSAPQEIPQSLSSHRAIRNITGMHELEELNAAKHNIRALKGGKDISLPTAHFSPEVLFREHNMVRTLQDKPGVREHVLDSYRTLRGANKMPATNSDLEAFNTAMGRLGTYGEGMRLNRSMRKHLADKLINAYSL